jgi:hypothetical protein
VHCEQQVISCVLAYLASTVVEPPDVDAICREVWEGSRALSGGGLLLGALALDSLPPHTHTHTLALHAHPLLLPLPLPPFTHQVRFLYADNKTLASLAHTPSLPPGLLLAGSLQRLDAMDTPGVCWCVLRAWLLASGGVPSLRAHGHSPCRGVSSNPCEASTPASTGHRELFNLCSLHCLPALPPWCPLLPTTRAGAGDAAAAAAAHLLQ